MLTAITFAGDSGGAERDALDRFGVRARDGESVDIGRLVCILRKAWRVVSPTRAQHGDDTATRLITAESKLIDAVAIRSFRCLAEGRWKGEN